MKSFTLQANQLLHSFFAKKAILLSSGIICLLLVINVTGYAQTIWTLTSSGNGNNWNGSSSYWTKSGSSTTETYPGETGPPNTDIVIVSNNYNVELPNGLTVYIASLTIGSASYTASGVTANSSNTATIYISGTLTLYGNNAGASKTGIGSSGTGTLNLYLAGNVESPLSGGQIVNSGTAVNVYFNGISDWNVSPDTSYSNHGNIPDKISIDIVSGGRLILQQPLLGSNLSTLTVSSGGVFDCANFRTSGFAGAAGEIDVQSGATLRCSCATGLDFPANNSPTFSMGATYVFYGTGSCVTGNLLPITVANLDVELTGSGSTLSLSNTPALIVSDSLNLNTGTFTAAANNITSDLIIANNSGTLSSTTGKLIGTTIYANSGGTIESTGTGEITAGTITINDGGTIEATSSGIIGTTSSPVTTTSITVNGGTYGGLLETASGTVTTTALTVNGGASAGGTVQTTSGNVATSTITLSGGSAVGGTLNTGSGTVSATTSITLDGGIEEGSNTITTPALTLDGGTLKANTVNISTSIALTLGMVESFAPPPATAVTVSLANSATSAITGGSSSSYIQGILERPVISGASSGVNTYNFPIGTSSNYELGSITFHNQTGISNITVSFNTSTSSVGLNTSLCTINGTAIGVVLNGGMWTFSANGNTTGSTVTLTAGTYDITLDETGFNNGMSNAATYGVIKYDASINSGAWAGCGGTNPSSWGSATNSTQSYTASLVVAERTGLNSFSGFGIGMNDYDIALPITLVSFNAVKDGDNTLITWQTATEQNTNHFDVQEASGDANGDAYYFSTIGSISAHGNSNSLLNYNFTDNQSGKSGVRYYRLKSVDDDGSYTYSDVKPVDFDNVGSGIGSLFPNPASASVCYSIYENNTRSVVVSIIDILGRILVQKTFNSSIGINTFSIDVSTLPKGMYILQSGDELNSNEQKFEKL